MTRARARKQPPDVTELELSYSVGELPSSQHRAGLAGLVLMCRWLDRQPDRKGICELTEVSSRSLTLRMDRAGLGDLFDQVYGARLVEVARPSAYPKKPPKRTEQREQVNPRTKKTETKTFHIYDEVVPTGAFLESWDPSCGQGDLWIKLWRDVMWRIMRGVPATRAPFEARANRVSDKLTPGTWGDLIRPDKIVDLPSTYYLGAQSRTADNASFYDRARHQFLLHFWPFVAQLYRPADIDNDGKRRFCGYAVAIPDVADLDLFCDELEDAMKARSPRLTAYVPTNAVIDLPIESALDLMNRLTRRIRAGHGHHEGLLYGVDVFHVDKAGNNVRVLATARVDARLDHDRYRAIRDTYRDTLFRRQRLLNFFGQKPWYAAFERLLGTTPSRLTIESSWFRADARRALQISDETRTDGENMNTDHDDRTPNEATPELQEILYSTIKNYIRGKLKSKHDIEWERVKPLADDHRDRKEYREKRQKIAKDAFLAVRSRTGADFVDYFSETLMSVPFNLSRERYAIVADALLNDTRTVRTLTLLALSAAA